MPDPDDPAALPVGPADGGGEPDRQDAPPPTQRGLDEPERKSPDDDDLPAGEPEDDPDDLTI